MKKRILSLLLASGLVFSMALLTVGCSPKAAVSPENAPEDTAALWAVGGAKDKIVVISDIHLGIEDKYTETLENKPLLIEFLQRLQNTTDVRELVIAGDFLDEWYLPVYYPSYTDVKQFYKNVIANNQTVIDEFNNVMDSGIKVSPFWVTCACSLRISRRCISSLRTRRGSRLKMLPCS